MPVQQLSLYDFLVDIFPGVVAIYLIQLILPVSEIPLYVPSGSGVQLAVVLLGAGYIVGRLLHSISSVISDILDGLVPVVEAPEKRQVSWNRFWYEFRKTLPIEDDEGIIDEMFSEGWAPAYASGPSLKAKYPYVDYALIIGIRDLVYEEYEFDSEAAEDRAIRHFLYSKLYRESTLYQRYNILTTFFRNMAIIFWFSSLVTLAQLTLFLLGIDISVYDVPWLKMSNPWTLPTMTSAAAVIFSRQLFKYSYRRNRHLILDSYQILKEGSTEEGDSPTVDREQLQFGS